MPSALPMMVGTKRNMMRSRAAKKMMANMMRGTKRRNVTTMPNFMPAKMIQHKTMDQEMEGMNEDP